jgi:hypothetical protein
MKDDDTMNIPKYEAALKRALKKGTAPDAAHNIACAQACIEPDKTTSLDDSAPHHQAEAHAKLGALACAFLAALGECITHDNATCLSRETAKQREIAALRRLQAINEIARAAIALTTKG